MTGAELPVPDEALRSGRLLSFGNGITEHAVRAIAMPVVLAELRRLAVETVEDAARARPSEDSSFYWGLDEIADRLRARADALDADPR